MANIPSSKKDAKRSAVRAQRNRSIRSSVKTKITKFRRGVTESGDGVAELAAIAVSALDRAVTKGVLHRNNAARRKSRLMKRLGPNTAPAVEVPSSTKVTRRRAPSAEAATAPKTRRTRTAKNT